jgi:hypothetical protein
LKGDKGGEEQVSEQVFYVSDPNNPILPPKTPVSFAMELKAQLTPIRGVAVDAEHSPGTVTIYGGRSPTGQGIVIQPGTARAFGIESTSAIFCVFGPATATGYARITAFGSAVVAYGIGTGAQALAAFEQKVNQRMEKIIDVLQAILAKLP